MISPEWSNSPQETIVITHIMQQRSMGTQHCVRFSWPAGSWRTDGEEEQILHIALPNNMMSIMSLESWLGGAAFANRAWVKVVQVQGWLSSSEPLWNCSLLFDWSRRVFTVGRVAHGICPGYEKIKRGNDIGKCLKKKSVRKTREWKIKKRGKKRRGGGIRSTSKENDPFVYLDDCRCHIGFFSRASSILSLFSISHYQHPSTQTHTHTHIYIYIK